MTVPHPELAELTTPMAKLGPGLVGYAPGVFDLFHVGHLNVLRRARLRCDHLIVGVVTDDSALRGKGRWPVVPEEERLAVVDAMRFVDSAVLEWTEDKMEIWEALRFDILFKGDDWRGSEKYTAVATQLARVGAHVVYLPYTSHMSTSQLRRVTNK